MVHWFLFPSIPSLFLPLGLFVLLFQASSSRSLDHWFETYLFSNINIWSYKFPFKHFLSCIPLILAPSLGFNLPRMPTSQAWRDQPLLCKGENSINGLFTSTVVPSNSFPQDGQREVYHVLTTFHRLPLYLERYPSPYQDPAWSGSHPPPGSHFLSPVWSLTAFQLCWPSFLLLSTHEPLSCLWAFLNAILIVWNAFPPYQLTNHPQT